MVRAVIRRLLHWLRFRTETFRWARVTYHPAEGPTESWWARYDQPKTRRTCRNCGHERVT